MHSDEYRENIKYFNDGHKVNNVLLPRVGNFLYTLRDKISIVLYL